MKRSVIPAIASGTFAAFRQAILSNRSYRDARPCTTDSPSLPISRAQPCRFLRSQMKACNWPRSIRRRTCCGKCAPSERNAGSRRRPAPRRTRKAAGQRLLRQRLRSLRVRPLRRAGAALPRTASGLEAAASGCGVALPLPASGRRIPEPVLQAIKSPADQGEVGGAGERGLGRGRRSSRSRSRGWEGSATDLASVGCYGTTKDMQSP